MNGATFCSGIGAPEVAAPWVDWRLASEIEKFPRAVLQERLGYRAPEDHNQGDPLLWGDMTEVTPDLLREHGVPLPEIIVAGTPCQAFSVAGLRKGTEDPRGNLTLAFVEICHAIVAARPDGRLAVLWENVPGVLSDSGNAFGAFVGGLVGADDALSPAGGGSWPSSGMVSGPRARLAWRVLDAQYFGVAQRRARVFVVVDFGGAVDPAAVLFERQSLHGNPPPSREARQDVAGTLSARTDGGGGLGTDFEVAGGLTIAPPVANTLTARMHKGINTTLDEWQTPIPIAFTSKDHGADAMEDLSPTLRAGGHDGSHANAGVPPAIAFNARQDLHAWKDRTGPLDTDCSTQAVCVTGQTTHTLTGEGFDASEDGTGRGTPICATTYAVRRLTPTEAARLQGFPEYEERVVFECRLSDLHEIVALAGGKNHNEQNDAPNARGQRSRLNAKSAGHLSLSVHLGHEKPVGANVLCISGREDQGRPKAERSNSSVKTAGKQNWSRRHMLTDNSAHQLARMISELVTQKASLRNGSNSITLENGKQFAISYGSETVRVVRNAAWSTDVVKQNFTFTTSLHGQPHQKSGWTPTTSFFSAVGVIIGCIPEKTPMDTSLRIDVANHTTHTRIPWRGKPAEDCPDGPRYKALGNSMCVNVVSWIMDRMRRSMEVHT